METCIVLDNVPNIIDETIKNLTVLSSLDTLENNTFDKIFIGEILSYIEAANIPNIVKTIKLKLKLGGSLVVEEFDQIEIASSIIYDRLSSANFNSLMKDRKQIFTISDIVYCLQQAGFEILEKQIDANKHYIEARSI